MVTRSSGVFFVCANGFANEILVNRVSQQGSTLDCVEEAPTGNEEVRAAEVIAACCLATDLGMGFPFEHGLHATLMAQRLAGLLGVDAETTSQTFYPGSADEFGRLRVP
jgi:hypothetical protein